MFRATLFGTDSSDDLGTVINCLLAMKRSLLSRETLAYYFRVRVDLQVFPRLRVIKPYLTTQQTAWCPH